MSNFPISMPQLPGWPPVNDGPQMTQVVGFGTNPGGLGMLVHIPENLPAGAPLVVVLHGCGQTAQGYAAGAGWLTLADRYGFAVLCPEQQAANNPNRCFNWFEPGDIARERGEAASIRQMVARAVADNDLDPGRIFVTGLSAGGGMTAVMLATYPETFAAGAIVAGLPYGAATNMQEAFAAMFQGSNRSAHEWGDLVRAASHHSGPWPRVTIWHGDADTTVKPTAAGELARQWIDVHGVSEAPSQMLSASGRPYLAWRSASGEPVVELHRLPGMGHGTPLATGGEDGVGAAGPFLLEVGVSSSLEIARFWGIAGDRVRSVQTASAPLRPGANVAPFDAASLLKRQQLDVGATISNALRAAGLMK